MGMVFSYLRTLQIPFCPSVHIETMPLTESILSIGRQTGLPNPITLPLLQLAHFIPPRCYPRPPHHRRQPHQKGSSLELGDFQLPHPEELSLPEPSSRTDLAESQSGRRLYQLLRLGALGYLWK